MSTHSLIGLKLDDGTIQYVYCHYDGYLEGVGKALITDYNSKKDAQKLVSAGSLRNIIGGTIDPFAGDEDIYKVCANEASYLEVQTTASYLYLFKDNNWYTADIHDPTFRKVQVLLSQKEVDVLAQELKICLAENPACLSL